MSNIKKGSKLTVSTGNGISRASSNNLGVLEVSGPGLANVVSQDSTFSLASSNVPQLSIGAIDNSGIFQLGLDNQGNAILEATENGSNNNILIQQLGGYVGIGTDNPASTFHINSTDALIIPVGTNTNRPGESGQITAQNGMIRYNTSTSQFEGYGPGSAWGSLGGVKDVSGNTYIRSETYPGAGNNDLQFFTAGQERMIIDSSGYVGIGTSTPQTELDISGQITANTKEYTHEIEFNNNGSYNNWILFNSSYGDSGNVPVDTDWTIEYKHKMTSGSGGTWSHFSVVLEEDGMDSSNFSNNTYFMYHAELTGENLTFRYNPANGTEVNEMIPGTGYRWSLFSDHVNVKLEFLTKNNTIRLYFNGENVQTMSNISNPSKIFGRWGFGDWNNNTHNIINPRITYGGKTYHLTTQHSTSSTAPTLTTTTKNIELINSTNNQINIPKLHSTELYADKMFVGRNNFNDYSFNAERKIVASDGAANDEFSAYAVDIDGDYAIVGAFKDDSSKGSAYIYNVHTGVELHKLTADDGVGGDGFGISVAIDGNYAIVGAYTDDSSKGSAYIFDVQTGAEIHKLTADDGVGGDKFGESVAISGNYAIVGAPRDDSDRGSAYIFNVQTGSEIHKLTADDGVGGDIFAQSVAISGNYAIVGAIGDDDKGGGSGSAYIFNVSTGTQVHKLTASDGATSDEFGKSVAIDGNYAIVGAWLDNEGATDGGTAYIFNIQTGEQLWKLKADYPTSYDYFGHSVAISGNYAIVGVRGDDDNANASGSAYIFDVRTGMQIKKITASDGATSDEFGHSVAISGNYAIVGARFGDSPTINNTGSAYIYGPTASSSYLLNINDDGNIGIGTTEPQTELHVQGAITTDQLYAGTGAPTDYTFSIEKKLLAHDGAGSDNFGSSVAIDGDYAIVGAYGDNSNTGAAYIVNVQTGAELHKLTASDGAGGDYFGREFIAISGNYAIVGAYGDNSSTGAAYIFNVQTGTQIHKLLASDGAAADYFGRSVDIDANYAIVGAWGDNSNTGSAYIFNVQTGIQLNKLTASDGAASDLFGYSVAISGNYAIVGARDHHTNGFSNSGAAYIFNIHTGEETHKLTAFDPATTDYFGYSVAIDGDYAVVSENRDDDKGNDAGAVYIFNVQTGTQLHKLTASDGAGGDNFGYGVDIDGNYVIVGAWADTINNIPAVGSAYIFDVQTGLQVKKITASDGENNDRFGADVAISGNYVIIGSVYDDNNGVNDTGSAYIYGPNDPLPPLLSIDNDSGNVGIGTTEPKSLLDVNGTLQATTLTSTNLKVGRDFSFSDETKLLASDGASGDHFGISVAIDGDYAIVGAYENDENGSNSGAAYIYNVRTGAEIHKLTASNGVASDLFGKSVAISGNYAIVGARFGDSPTINDSGTAYIFNVETGQEIHKLYSTGPGASERFGSSVAIHGNYAVIGERYDADKGSNAGAAYIFNVQTGTQLLKLTASDGAANDNFGQAVAISGNYAIVGAYNNSSGFAYIYNIHTGSEIHKFNASDSVSGDYFGISVAIDGNYAIVGAEADDDDGISSGSAYIFNVQTGTQLWKLLASDAGTGQRFGTSVAISGNYAIVGALFGTLDGSSTSTGSAYIFDVRTGMQVKKITASDAVSDYRFGNAVAISGNYAIVGSYFDDTIASTAGAAYIYGPSSPYLLSIEDGVTDIPNLVTTGLTSGNFNAGRDFSFSNETKILAHDGAGGDQFGISVAIDGNYAIVGAYEDDDNYSGSGSAYIYNVHTGAEIRKLVASDGATNDYFGRSVAISGNYAIVGAYYDDDKGGESGSAYIFNVQTGAQLHKLVASDGAGDDKFGVSVAISGNYAIVGSQFGNGNTTNSGTAYIYNVQTGVELHILAAEDGANTDYFGRTVAISGNYAIVGAYYDDDKGDKSGSAYIFNVQTGVELHKLLASDGVANDEFGISVAIDGKYAIVGARFDDDSANASGSAYIYNVQTGAELHKLVASDPDALVYFGTSVGISGNYAIVGAEQDNQVASDAGAAYIFDVRTGHQVKKITASDGAATDIFGWDTAISGNYAIVAARFNDDDGGQSGSAYIYGPSSPSLLSIDNDSGNVNVLGGNVGIGTTTPEYPLHLQTTIVKNYSGSLGYLPSSGSSGQTSFSATHIGSQISIKASGSIWSDIYMLVGSDIRIKEKIEEVPDALALQQVRTIPCKYYEYKDKFKKGFGKTIGFIAQEVREILPMAISIQTDFVPDEMRVLTDISWNGTTLYTDISGSSAKYRFYVSDDLSGNGAIEKEITGSGSTGFKFDKQYNFVFCYGKKVNDFHTVDKSKIFALNFAATQELDRIQQQQATTIQTLQTDLSNANTTIQQQATTIQTLETQIADILTRLSNLENTGSA